MTLRALFAASLAALLVACGGSKPADPALMQDHIGRATLNLVDDLSAATVTLDGAQGSRSIKDALHALHQSFSFVPEVQDLKLSPEQGHALADFLKQHVFTAANHEGEGVYRLRGADFCPNGPSGAPEADCVKNFDALELRVRALAFDDRIELTLLIGPARSEPVTFTLRETQLSLSLNLGEAKVAIQHIAKVSGQTLELPAVLEGVVSASLTRNAAQDFTLAFSIDRSLKVQGQLPEQKGPYALTLEARTPVFSVRANGPAKTLAATLDVGAFTAQAPWASLNDQSHATGTLAVDVKGLTAAVALSDGDTQVRFTNLSLGGGTSTISLGATALVSATLNPASNGRFSLTIAQPAAGKPTLTLDPGLDLAVAFDLRPLQAAGDDVDSRFVHDTYRAQLTGAAPSAQPVDETATFPGGLAIRTGSLAISCDTQTVTVPAGQCLVGNDPVTPGENALVGKLAAQACP